MNSKRIASVKLLAILAICVFLSACGGGSAAGGGTPGPAGPAGTPGADGSSGATGPQGQPGVATIPAGTVSSTDKIAVVSGTLTPDSGVPASETSGANVYAVGQQGSGATTDANGSYTVTVNLSSASQISVVQKPLLQRIVGWMKGEPKAVTASTQVGLVAISATGGHGKKINLNLQDGTAVNLPNIAITTVGKISGNVKLQNGTDHTGILVFIPGTSFAAYTDAAGNFTITNVPEGDYSYLRATSAGYKYSMLSSITVASNATTTVRDQLLLIDTGATGSILINAGAAVSTNKQVTVNVAASSTAILMLYSESSIFLNAAWEPLQSSFTYTFPSEGAKTLYIKFADANGLESAVYSDSITVNSNWVEPLTLPSSGARTKAATPTFTWTADSLAATYDLVISKNADLSTPDLTVTGIAAATDTLTAGQALPASAGQLYYWSVRPVDATGVTGNYATASSFTLDTAAPTVSSTTPANNAAAVAPASAISATMSEDMDSNSLSTATFAVNNGSNIVGTVTYDSAAKKATFTPSANLVGSMAYTATLSNGSAGVKDVAGNPIAANYLWSFTTAQGWGYPASLTDHLSSAGNYIKSVTMMSYTWPQVDVAMDSAGNAVMVWTELDTSAACGGPCYSIFSARFNRSTRTWTYPTAKDSANALNFTGTNVLNVDVDMDDAGNIIAVWEQADSNVINTASPQVYKAEYRGGVWTKPANLAAYINPVHGAAPTACTVDMGCSLNPRVAMDRSGTGKAVIAYQGWDGSKSRIYKSFYNGAAWTHSANLAADALDVNLATSMGYPSAAMAGGKAIIAWQGPEVVAQVSTMHVYAATYNGVAWTLPTAATDHINFTASTVQAGVPDVAMSGNGTGIVVWSQASGANLQIFASRWSGAAWTNPASFADKLSPSGSDATYPRVAMDGAGKGIVAWTQYDNTVSSRCNFGGCVQVFKSYFNGATWQNPTSLADNISPDGQHTIFYVYPTVAMGSNGDGIVAWAQYTNASGTKYSLYKSTFKGGVWTNPAIASDSFGFSATPGYWNFSISSPSGKAAMGNTNGDAMLIWMQDDGDTTCGNGTQNCFQIFKAEYR